MRMTNLISGSGTWPITNYDTPTTTTTFKLNSIHSTFRTMLCSIMCDVLCATYYDVRCTTKNII